MNHALPRALPAARRRLLSARGFTILEVALASTIMALGLSTAIFVMQAGFKAIDVARDNTLASQILQSEMERLRLMPWSNSTSALDSITELVTPETVSLSDMFSSSAVLASRFTVERTITPDSTRSGDVRYIRITVTWRTLDVRSQTRSFRSMYAMNGLYDYYTTIAPR